MRARRPVVARLPYDGNTWSGQIVEIERLTGETVARVCVDRAIAASEIHVTQGQGQRFPTVEREQRQRAAFEPIIGHTRDPTLSSNAAASPAPMPSTPSSSASDTTSTSSLLGSVLFRLRLAFIAAIGAEALAALSQVGACRAHRRGHSALARRPWLHLAARASSLAATSYGALRRLIERVPDGEANSKAAERLLAVIE